MLTATVLALTAAVLHAGWNLAVKQSGDRWISLWGLFCAAGLIGLPISLMATFRGELGWAGWGWALSSGGVHVMYLWRLARMYDIGDYSSTYPIARGGGALAAAVGGVLLLQDHLSLLSAIGIGIVIAGLMMLAGRMESQHVWAGLSVAATIGVYTVIDSKGSRSTEGSAYATCLFVTGSSLTTLWGIAHGRWNEMRSSIPIAWKRYLGTGLASLITYWLVLLAVRRAPVGYVTALRESSVVIATFLGWRFLDERGGLKRVLSALVIVAGLVTLVAGR